jgi:hypothetical protein
MKTRRDRVRNEDVRKTLNTESLESKIVDRRLRWYGHMKRMSEECLPKKMQEMKDQDQKGDPEIDTLMS